MNLRALLLWTISAILMVWIGATTWHGWRVDSCIAEGGRWDLHRGRCVPDAARIILQRDLNRS